MPARQWEDQDLVRYEAQFGAAQPDLETILLLLGFRARRATGATRRGEMTSNSAVAV